MKLTGHNQGISDHSPNQGRMINAEREHAMIAMQMEDEMKMRKMKNENENKLTQMRDVV